MFKYSSKDLYRYSGKNDFSSFLKVWRNEPSYRYLFFFRIIKAKGRKSIPGFVARFFLKRLSYRFGIQIPYETDIAEGFYIGHFGTIVINGMVRIGKNCNIAPGATIGQVIRGEKKGVPTIGNNVWIGTNAVIVGNITIGEDVLIAPGSYVNFDVPSHSMVLGNPAIIKHRDNVTDEYITKTV